jgi:hypothetical protein
MQPCRHCSHRYAYDSCSLLSRQLLPMIHIESLSIDAPQSVKRLTKQDADLVFRAFLLRIRSRLNHLKSGTDSGRVSSFATEGLTGFRDESISRL